MSIARLFRFITFFFVVFSFSHCASPKPLAGGVKDETPPSVIEAESTVNEQTNFNDDEIVITFDEWIVLKDVYSQLVISPPMPDDPEITQKGKSVIISLPDSLRDETTYTINFGNAITDLNEGNPLENYVFVFSTGSVLDSNSVSGTVIDAVTLQPVDDIWVMMYFTGKDSSVYKSKPDYIARTDEKGNWSIGFLPIDSFHVVALKDENLNFLYDQEGELFGWADEIIYTADDEEVPPIFVFPKENRIIVTDIIHPVPGWMKIVIESPIPKPIPVLEPAIEGSTLLWMGDTLNVFYDPSANYTGYVILNGDSTRVRASTATNTLSQPLTLKMLSGRIKPGSQVLFSSNIPISSLNENLIIVRHDSLGEIAVVANQDSLDNRKISISGPWTGGTRYPVIFLPGALTDYWGRENDTVRHSIVVTGEDQFGDLFLTIDGLDSTKHYLILLNEGDQLRETFVVEGVSNTRLVKKGLLPGSYKIDIIEDLNRNGVWDTGNYDRKTQPEKKMIFTPEALRAGWEQEVKLTWNK